MSDKREWGVTRNTTYTVDVAKLREQFGRELHEDGIDTEDDFEVTAACWENGVRDPYFVPTIFDDWDYYLSRSRTVL